MTLTKNAMNNLTISKSIHLHCLGTYVSGEHFYLFLNMYSGSRNKHSPAKIKPAIFSYHIFASTVVSIKVVSCSIHSREMSSHWRCRVTKIALFCSGSRVVHSCQIKAQAELFSHRSMLEVLGDRSEASGNVFMQKRARAAILSFRFNYYMDSFEHLAEAVRKYITLYGSSGHSYEDNQMANNSWMKIAQTLCMEESICQRVWCSLHDKYMA